MARMYPSTLDMESGYRRDGGTFVSNAERSVFSELQSKLNDEWDIFHSVWFRDSAGGEHAEGDFILIGPESVLLLEVKGGVVERESSGKWYFTTNRGKLVNVSDRGPVDQARAAWYALKNHIKENAGKNLISEIVWGYGVITPECEYRVSGADPGFSKTLWLGENGFPEHLNNYIQGLSTYWKEDQASKSRRACQPGYKIKPATRELLIRNIRPRLGYIEGMGIEARRTRRHLIKLTQKQYTALDYSRLEPRIVLEGGAGTGKTLLAIKKAIIEADDKRVLFTCFNNLLANRLATQVFSDPALRNITILNYHQLVMQILRRCGRTVEVPVGWQQFNEAAPDLILDALADSGIKDYQWDCLVIDEGQDLMSREFFGVLDMLLKGGLSEGRWLLCVDTEQAIFSDQYDAEFSEELINKNAFRVNLSENCRNTHQISAYGHAIGDVPKVANTSATGPNPNIQYYKDLGAFKRDLKKLVNRLVTDFRNADMDESNITILLAKRGDFEEAVKEVCATTVSRGEWLSPRKGIENNYVQISTIQAFKGLESDAVILAGFESLDPEYLRRLFYVGATRARSILEVMLPEDAAAIVEDKIGEILNIIHSSADLNEISDFL